MMKILGRPFKNPKAVLQNSQGSPMKIPIQPTKNYKKSWIKILRLHFEPRGPLGPRGLFRPRGPFGPTGGSSRIIKTSLWTKFQLSMCILALMGPVFAFWPLKQTTPIDGAIQKRTKSNCRALSESQFSGVTFPNSKNLNYFCPENPRIQGTL